MKHIKLNIRLLSTLLFVLGLIACTNDDINNSQKEIIEGLPTTVSLKLSSATPMVVETKAADSEGKFGVINNLAILVYKTETGALDKATLVADLNAKEWGGEFNATTGKRRIYVLANHSLTEDEIKSTYATEDDLLNSGLINAATITPTGNEQMLSFVQTSISFNPEFTGSQASNITLSETPGTLYARLYPPYSKITFTIKNETTMSERVVLNIKNVSVRNLPTKYSLLPLADPFEIGANVNSGKTELSDTDDVYEFYMYENPQGVIHGENTDPKLKSPFEGALPSATSKIDYTDWEAKWATKTPCTYIEIEGSYTIWKSEQQNGSGTIHYRFFLGEDAVKDFNIKRNTHYKVDLVFKGTAGYSELDYEWRVNADLTDVTIVPEGTLEIDGSPDYWFPFVVVNGTGGAVKITTAQKQSNMKIEYLVPAGPGYDAYWSDASQVEDIGTHSYEEYHIRVNEFGIIGSAGFKEGENVFIDKDGTSSYTDLKDNFNNRDEIRQGLIYIKRKYTVYTTPSTDYYVKVYPLLFLNDQYYNTANNNTVYAQRFDRSEGLVDKAGMEKLCTGNYVNNGVMHVLPPRVSDLEKMIKLETYAPFKPKKEGPYWTTDGLYNWTASGPVKATDATKGYVRCTYRTNK